MPELNLPAPNLVVGRDHYMSRVKSWSSLLALPVTVDTTPMTLNELIGEVESFAFTHPTAPGIVLTTADGIIKTFTGNLITDGVTANTQYDSDYSTVITPGSITMDFTDGVVVWSETVTDDGGGILAGDDGSPAAGTIDYTTGEWSLTFNAAAPEDAYYDLALSKSYIFSEGDVQALWISPASAIYGTFDGVAVPATATTNGIAISEAMLLSAQPGLISNMTLEAEAATIVWLELLV